METERVETGEKVPDFVATLHDGSTVRLTTLLESGPVVLFFYPKAFTGGCTQEACHFRDLAADFEEAGAQRVGVSRDSVATQARFGAANELDFPLISDVDGAVARLFGAKRLGPIPNRRQTFVIDTDRTLVGRIESENDMERHADDALAMLLARAK